MTNTPLTAKSAALLQDQQKLYNLKIEQNDIIDNLKSKGETLKSKTIRLAQIIEERYLLNDPEFFNDKFRNFAVSQISTYITELYEKADIAYAPYVYQVLDSKYKDTINQNNALVNRKVAPCQYGGIDPVQLIEELSKVPQDMIKSLPTATKTLFHELMTSTDGWKNTIETDSYEKHYQLFNKKTRKTIKTPRPFKPEATEYSEEIHKHALVMLEWEQYVIQNPPPEQSQREEFARGERRAAQVLKDLMNEKYSLDPGGWLMRDLYRVHQSKHGAAVKDRVPTLLCKKCSILDRKDWQEGDFVQCEWHWPSPHHWRCPRCLEEEEFVLRGLTREQCGDKGYERCPNCNYRFTWDIGISPMDAMAIDLVHNLPGYYNSLTYYNEFIKKFVATRKVSLGVDLSSKTM